LFNVTEVHAIVSVSRHVVSYHKPSCVDGFSHPVRRLGQPGSLLRFLFDRNDYYVAPLQTLAHVLVRPGQAPVLVLVGYNGKLVTRQIKLKQRIKIRRMSIP
jgi:hypothetical protein